MMNKQALKRILTAVFAAVALAAIILISKKTELFAGLEDVQNGIEINGAVILNLVLAIALIVLISNIILLILGLFKSKSGRIGTLAAVGSSLVNYTSALIAFCWCLSIIGVNVSTIFAGVGILALIIGFGAESLVADLVTGVFILFENQYNVGDIIEIDGFRGTVKEIGIRTISLEDIGGNIKIINNSELKNIINRSNQRSVTVCDVSVSYETDLEKLEEKLVEILPEIKKKHSDIFVDRVEYVGVEELSDSGVVLRIIADVAEENIFNGRRLLNKEIKIMFDKAGIIIPYPQLDVHTK
ncbi:MAG: mechanosensitive ion channel family protein [Firmicutes bacterium]|nr:mechanosensitive ion channel family protein [Bacillota bacterium]